jgi:tetratricopeptide (TPR) repeat protein
LMSGVSALAAPPAPATGTATDDATLRARQWVEVASQEYSKQRWDAARDAYLKAWNLKQHFAIAANLADVEMRLGLYREAAEHWTFYLAHLPAERAERRADAEKQLLECRAHLSGVRVSVNIEGTQVVLDNVAIGRSPLPPELWLVPGKHVLAAAQTGYANASREFESAPGESREIALVLKHLPPARSEAGRAPESVSAAESGPSGIQPRTVVLVGGGVLTLTAVGVGIAYALKATSAGDEADDLRVQTELEGAPKLVLIKAQCTPPPDKRPPACSALARKVDDTDTFRNVSIVAFVAGGVFGVATLVTYFAWPAARSETRRPKVSLSPWSLGGANGVQISGQF